MFSFFEKKKGDVIDHWYALVPGFNTSTKDFYESVQQELKAREVPGLEMSSILFAEGGILSNEREYLRMTRERLVFDICAAPFGTAYFFSCRFTELSAEIKLWQLIVVLIALCVIIALTVKLLGFVLGLIAFLAGLVFLLYLLRNAVSLGLKDLDAALIKSPIVGPIYERFFRRETYYRQDTRLMYRDTVNAVVKAKVEEVTGASGIKLLQFNDYNPILGELYKPTMVKLPKE